MKKHSFLSMVVCLLLTTMAPAKDHEPVLIRGGEVYHFNNWHRYARGYSTNLFKDVNGNLHGAYVDNYELFYFFSEDEGETWQTEQVITGYEGKIKMASIVVSSNGRIFIPFEIHPDYDYGANPIAYSTEFIFQVYCAVYEDEKGWTFELVIDNKPGSNQGYMIREVYIDSDDNVFLYTDLHGWYNYGGTILESKYDAADESWSTAEIFSFSDTPINNSSRLSKVAVNPDGDAAIMFWRTHVNKWVYSIKPSGGDWQELQIFDENPSFRHFSLTAAHDGSFHIVWVSGELSTGLTLNYQHGFEGTPAELYEGEPEVNLIPSIHIDPTGKKTVIVAQTEPHNGFWFTKEPDGEWSEILEFPSNKPVIDLYTVKHNPGYFSHFQTLFFNQIREGTDGPHGPDSLYFWQVYNYKELTLDVYPSGAGTVDGAGAYNIQSQVNIEAMPADNYLFLHWEDEEQNIVSSSPEFSFEMPLHDYNLTAVFEIVSGIADLPNNELIINLYPNPASSHIIIDFEDHNVIIDKFSFSLFDYSGKLILSEVYPGEDAKISVEGLSAGMYFIRISTENGKMQTLKLIKH